jgi:hypothetical protein
MQNPFGCGAVGAVCELALFCDALLTAAVETADANMKMPANARVLSIGFSCGVVGADDARLSTRRTVEQRHPAFTQGPHRPENPCLCG